MCDTAVSAESKQSGSIMCDTAVCEESEQSGSICGILRCVKRVNSLDLYV